MSDATQSAFGPSLPKALMVTCTRAGLMAASSRSVNAGSVSISTSAPRTNSISSSRVEQTTLALPRL